MGISDDISLDEFKDMLVHAKVKAMVYTSDMVSVVRCRDCKHWETDWTQKGMIQGFHFCPMVGFVTREDFYCADGERREDK